MRERELENVMSDFYHQKFNVLVCTTIIESGIDVPSANTIIINRADKFGLAQLHQLRGPCWALTPSSICLPTRPTREVSDTRCAKASRGDHKLSGSWRWLYASNT